MQRRISRLIRARAYTVYKAFGDAFMQAGSDFYSSLDPDDPEFLEAFQKQFPEIATDEWGYMTNPSEASGNIGIHSMSDGTMIAYLDPIN